MSESYKKVTVIVEDAESIETSTFHVATDFSGKVIRPEMDGPYDPMANRIAPFASQVDVELKFTAHFDPVAGNIFITKKDLR